MSRISLRISGAAATDIVEQADWYQAQSAKSLAQRWEKAVTSALLRVVKHPEIGPLCRFKHSDLQNVRRVPIRGFPRHLIFYQFRQKDLLVLRVLHGARDLESLL
jgi:toxin ParE1/3/4